MKAVITLLISFFLWLGLLLGLLLITHSGNKTAMDSDKSSVLFVMYCGFSWSIALMAFVMDLTRRRLFQAPKLASATLRLVGYACLAILLALLTSPWLNTTVLSDALIVVSWVIVYCTTIGSLYVRFILSR